MTSKLWRDFDQSWSKDIQDDRNGEEWNLADGIGLYVMTTILSYSFLVISNRLRRTEESCKEHYESKKDFETIPAEERSQLKTSEISASRITARDVNEKVQAFFKLPDSSDKILTSLKPWGYTGIISLSSMIIQQMCQIDEPVAPTGPATYRARKERERIEKEDDGKLRDVRPWLVPGAKWFPVTPCKYFIQSRCSKSETCTFLHQAPPGYIMPSEEEYRRKARRRTDRSRSPPDRYASERSGDSRYDDRRREPYRERSPAERYEERRDRGSRYDDDRRNDRRSPRSSRYDDRRRSGDARHEPSPSLLTKPAVSASDAIKNGEPLLFKVQSSQGSVRDQAIDTLNQYLTLQSKSSPARSNVHILEYLLGVIERAPAFHRPRYLKFMNDYLEAVQGTSPSSYLSKIRQRGAQEEQIYQKYQTISESVNRT